MACSTLPALAGSSLQKVAQPSCPWSCLHTLVKSNPLDLLTNQTFALDSRPHHFPMTAWLFLKARSYLRAFAVPSTQNISLCGHSDLCLNIRCKSQTKAALRLHSSPNFIFLIALLPSEMFCSLLCRPPHLGQALHTVGALTVTQKSALQHVNLQQHKPRDKGQLGYNSRIGPRRARPPAPHARTHLALRFCSSASCCTRNDSCMAARLGYHSLSSASSSRSCSCDGHSEPGSTPEAAPCRANCLAA